jgi:hypothetical protein
MLKKKVVIKFGIVAKYPGVVSYRKATAGIFWARVF